MKIEPEMDLEQLAERIYVNAYRPGRHVAVARRMCDLLNLDAEQYGWLTTTDVEDVLADHYMVRKVPDGMVEFDGKARREAWEVRLRNSSSAFPAGMKFRPLLLIQLIR